jgi:hypothetical protein
MFCIVKASGYSTLFAPPATHAGHTRHPIRLLASRLSLTLEEIPIT